MQKHLKTHKRHNKTRRLGGATFMGKGSTAGKGTGSTAGKGKGSTAGKGKGKGSTAGKGSRRNRPPTPPRLLRSCTRSSMLFDSLYGNEENQNNLKRKFNKDDTIKQALFQLHPQGEVPNDIVFFLNPIESGIYLNWATTGKQILHVTIHTGVYKEGSTARMVDECVQRGNMHITFDLLPHKDEVKLSVDDKMIVDISPKRKLKTGMRGNEITTKAIQDDIIAKIIELIQIYIDETFPRR